MPRVPAGKKRRATNAGPRLWERSPDPEEFFDPDQEWPVGEIVDMYVDAMDPTIRHYKITWPTWKREDGSNTTWMSERDCMDQFAPILNAWKRKYANGKAKLPAPANSTSLFHLDVEETVYRIRHPPHQRLLPPSHSAPASVTRRDDDSDLDIVGSAARPSKIVARKRPRSPSSSTASSSRRASAALPVERSTSPTATPPPSPTTSRARMRNQQVARPPSSAGTLVNARASTSKKKTAVGIVPATEWEEDFGDAVLITFVNEVDDEERPVLPNDFRYLEAKYLTDNNNALDTSFFAACSCSPGPCTRPERCDCQAESTLDDGRGKKIVAYDRNGRYTFPAPGALVIECNDACTCSSDSCINRVAQRPRDVPLQIFKTTRCGWGVRATARLERGQVLGLYTGELIPRDKAHALKVPQKHYAFDLDFNEDEAPDDNMNDKWSVSSYRCGNWSRFLNHCCDPNVLIYPVLFDHPEIPKLAFVAAKDLDPFEELVIDYHDAAGVRADKRPKRRPKHANNCECDAGPKCRKWFPG